MKRMHLHISVNNLQQAISFYSELFDAQPSVTKEDYAKWMLDDPYINFAVSTQGKTLGLDHLGIQVEEEGELNSLRERLKKADLTLFSEGETVCCYAKSDKSWLEDPAGIAWEAYHTMGEANYFKEDDNTKPGACCTPQAQIINITK